MSTEVKVAEFPKCDLAGDRFGPCSDGRVAHYDGATTMGPWAYMCEVHFTLYGLGLGTGVGQKLVLRG